MFPFLHFIVKKAYFSTIHLLSTTSLRSSHPVRACALNTFRYTILTFHACFKIYTSGEKICLKDRHCEHISHIFQEHGRTGKGQKEKQSKEERQPPKQG